MSSKSDQHSALAGDLAGYKLTFPTADSPTRESVGRSLYAIWESVPRRTSLNCANRPPGRPAAEALDAIGLEIF